MSIFLGYALIFLARVIDVSCSTMRVLLLVRGKRWLASGIGFIEVLVYVLALNQVVGQLGDPLKLVFYGLGFATGNLVGSFLEEKVAMGYLTVQVIPHRQGMAPDLRREGFGVTILTGMGSQGPHEVLQIILRRRELSRLSNLIKLLDRQAFVCVLDTRSTQGGIFCCEERRSSHLTRLQALPGRPGK